MGIKVSYRCTLDKYEYLLYFVIGKIEAIGASQFSRKGAALPLAARVDSIIFFKALLFDLHHNLSDVQLYI